MTKAGRRPTRPTQNSSAAPKGARGEVDGRSEAPVFGAGGSDPVFPEMARLELDQLLEQLVGRAQEVLASRDRLRGLLQATRLVTAELALPVVLRQIVESARDLVGASFAALGVVAPDGDLEQFIHVGMDAQTVDRIGDLPRGRGILGLLVTDPSSLRLDDLSTHPASYGFPEEHPPMHSFLGVPIRVRGEIYGNLYLTDKRGAERFSAEDEELATALAATAAVAIENARLFEDATRRQRGQEATARIATALLSADTATDPLALVLGEARALVDAEAATIMRPSAADPAVLEVLAAPDGAVSHHVDAVVPLPASLAELVHDGGPVLMPDAGTDPRAGAVPTSSRSPGPLLAVPLPISGGSTVLTVTRAAGRAPFTSADQETLTRLAEQVAVGLELASARADAERVRLLEDRDRIARDMHDHVIGRLFGAGMAVQGLTRWISDPAGLQRLAAHADDLDSVVRDIRTSIYALDRDREQLWGLPSRVQQVIAEAIGHLGFAPTLHLDSGVNLPSGSAAAHNLLAVLREALSNISRHAQASAVEITLAGGETIDLVITDDGRGLPQVRRAPSASGGHGLANMADRATTLGGTFSITNNTGPGATLHWSIPTPGGQHRE